MADVVIFNHPNWSSSLIIRDYRRDAPQYSARLESERHHDLAAQYLGDDDDPALLTSRGREMTFDEIKALPDFDG
jgi:hypothetical protein